MTSPTPCPCDSGKTHAECCGPYLAGQSAPTAVALMRSRYSAYVRGDDEYLQQTWHPSTRPARLESRHGPLWTGLTILSSDAGGVADDSGTVEFIARFIQDGRAGALHETSRFVREAGRWYYQEGTLHPSEESKVGRNAPCPCGSGRKFKRCCAA